MRLNRLALYLRYSFDSQSPMSIEDQQRRCLALAKQYGFDVESVLVFSDEEMSGYKLKEALSRPGFKALLAAWDRGEFDVLVVDELSRLGRNGKQLLEVTERLERGTVRFLSVNGLDSANPSFQVMVGIQGVMAAEESRGTGFRVKRGMAGQLERGYMIAQPPFGYRGERLAGMSGARVGTVWHPYEAEAELVREMYRRRNQGASFAAIAEWLNESGVRPSRRGRLWRPAGVQRVLENSIYRGEFTFHGSNFSRYQAKKTGQQLEVLTFPREGLRLVSDEEWHGAQAKGISRTGYGGGRNQYSGLIECGCCGSTLSATSGGKAMSCGTCAVNLSVGDKRAPASVPSISVAGLNQLTEFALQHAFDEERIALVRARLRDRLDGGPQAELSRLKRDLARARQGAEQLLRFVRMADGPDELLDKEYADARAEIRRAERALTEAERTHAEWNGADLAAQLQVDATSLAGKLLDGALEASAVRAVLAKLFPRFVLLGRETRHISRFDIEFAPGVAVAWLSGTKPQLEERVRMVIRLGVRVGSKVSWWVECERLEILSGTDSPTLEPTN